MRTAPERHLLEMLQEVKRKTADAEFDSPFGICWHVDGTHLYDKLQGIEVERAEQEMHRLFALWPNYSGSHLYPVPDPDHPHGDDEFGAYWFAGRRYEGPGSVWTGEYGALRRELLDFMIAELEARGDR